MTEEERAAMVEARREYYRNWRKNHPENVKRATERYWHKKLKEIETCSSIERKAAETREGAAAR